MTLMTAAAAGLANEAKPPMPLPEIVVAKTTRPPVIDGRMEPGEWDFATAGTGFHAWPANGDQGRLAHDQSVFFVTYDDQYLYVCFKNYRGTNLTLLAKNARETDDVKIVFDDANEIWFSPPAAQPVTFQTMFNSYPAVFDVRFVPSIGVIEKGWSGRWEMAATETREYWIVEGRAPIRAFGSDRIKDGNTWRALFTTDLMGRGGQFRRWGAWVTPGFKDIGGHDTLHFRDVAPAVQVLDVESVLGGQAELAMAVTGPARGRSTVTVSARFGATPAAAAGDRVLTKTIEVADGKRETFTLATDLTSLNLPRTPTAGAAAGQAPMGFCEITAVTDAGLKLYAHVFRFVVDGYQRTPPAAMIENPYDTPFGVSTFHAPLSKKLVVNVDRLYMRNRAEVTGGSARLLDKETGGEVAHGQLLPFIHDYAKFILDLKDLTLPVETEEAWAAKNKTALTNAVLAEANQELKRAGQREIPLKPAPGPFPREFTLETVLTGSNGLPVAQVKAPVKLMDCQYEWLGHDLGISDKVISPWTPIEWRNNCLSMWDKTYRLNALGLAEEIADGGTPLLATPMRLVAAADGHETALATGLPAMKKLTEAYADLAGTTVWGDLEVQVQSRVEFDGFVRTRMTLNPRKPVPLDRLSLVVSLPAAVAEFMAASPGGHCSVNTTPPTWSSRTLASGSRVGSFVPYIFFTDSERGFCWCADNDQGWVIDPQGDALTVTNDGRQVTLRVNFVQQPAILTKPVTIDYAWTVTPQKPRPADWRAWSFNSGSPVYPQMRRVFFGNFDRRRVWDYYSSPYPFDMEKSRREIQEKAAARSGVTFCVGQTGDSLGWWEDYKGRDFSVLTADWATVPGEKGDGEITRARGANDYELWHWDRWIRMGDLEGVYFDCNSLDQEWNFLGGTAYLRPDGRVQPGYSYLGQREYFKRLRYLLASHGKTRPYLFHHTTGSCPVFAWLTDVLFEAEDVAPSDSVFDYLAVYPVARMRTLGMGESIGGVPLFVCAGHENQPFHRAQFIGWTALHDTIEGSMPWHQLAAESELWQGATRFIPYWKPGQGLVSSDNDVWASAHVRPGHALVWIMNTAREAREAVVSVDAAKLGLEKKRLRVFDAETGEPVAFAKGRITVQVPARLWRAVRLAEVRTLKENQTFAASFDAGEVAADEALGNRYAVGSKDVERAIANGKTGLGVDLDTAHAFWTRHHLAREAGWVAWSLQAGTNAEGTLLAFKAGHPAAGAQRELRLSLSRGKLRLESVVAEPAGEPKAPMRIATRPVAAADWPAAASGASWQTVRVAWQDRSVTVTVDDAPVLRATLVDPVPVAEREHALETFSRERLVDRIQPSLIVFGSLKGAVMDDLVMGK